MKQTEETTTGRHQKLNRSLTQSMTGPLNHNGAKEFLKVKFNKIRNDQMK